MSTDPQYHGNDLAEAYKRAKKINGQVVFSLAPGSGALNSSPVQQFGYWSDSSTFVRSWERLVYSAGSRKSLAAIVKAEARFVEVRS